MTLYEADLELIQNTLSSLSLEVRTLLQQQDRLIAVNVQRLPSHERR